MKLSGKKIHFLAELAVLTAIVVLLQLIGNTIRIGEFSISLILLPIVVGAVMCGQWGGAWLGLAFGTVIILSGDADAFYAISPIKTIAACILRGALAGFIPGLVYVSLREKKEGLAIILASVLAPVMNTALFIITCLMFFYDVFVSIMGAGNVLSGMITSYVSINFLLELALNMALAPILVHIAKHFEEKGIARLRAARSGEKTRNRRKLAVRLIIAVMLLGVVICTVSSLSGYKNYKKNMQQQYSDTALQIAELAKSTVSTQLLRECSAALADPEAGSGVTQSEDYLSCLNSLSRLREKMEANEICVFTADLEMLAAGPEAYADGEWQPITYLFDSRRNRNETKSFGQSGSINPDFVSELAMSIGSGQSIGSSFVSGNTTTAVYQVLDDVSGELLATIAVELPMDAIESSLRSDIVNSIVIMVSIEIIFIALYLYYISGRLIAPIRIISQEVSGFVGKETSSADSLSQINTHDEIQQLAEDIVQMEQDINTYIANITAITAEKERIGAELNVATKIQADMLPSIFPAFPSRTEFDIYASMTPAKEVGGDFYDFFLLDEDHLALVIADVSGKGVPAALFMVIAKTLLKNQASFERSPKLILEAVNNQLCENNTSEMFVTTWMCIYEISTGNCVAANAGHEYPAIRKANGDFELLHDRHGFVLAGMENSRYREYSFNIEKGGALFVYTDGVAEATDRNDELFGTDRMLEALNLDSDAVPSTLIANTMRAIDAFVGDAPQFDDITMLCLRRH